MDNALINLGELSKPATALIERISDAVTGICKPFQIKRVAKAESEARVIAAKTDLEIFGLRERALSRFILEEEKKQRNMEEIVEKALPMVTEESKPNQVEDDWLVNFFEKCRLISDEDMQILWAKVLSGESNNPGSFSKRTVNALSTMSRKDAEIITKISTFKWVIAGDTHVVIFNPTLYDKSNGIYNDVDLRELLHLESIGILNLDVNNMSGFVIGELEESCEAVYFSKVHQLIFPESRQYQLPIGMAFLSQIGAEILALSEGRYCQEFYDYVLRQWEVTGIQINV